MRIITVFVVVAVVLTVVFQPVFFAHWDQRAKDVLTSWAGGGHASNQVVIVAIDDAALAQFGRWPWSRDRLSDLVQKIQNAAPATVALDMMFPEPDLASPGGVARAAANDRQAPYATNDDVLATTLQRGRFVLGFHLKFASGVEDSNHCQPRPLPIVKVDTEDTHGAPFFKASGLSCSVEKLSNASAADGFLNASPDADGVLRRVPLLAEYHGTAYPSLALAAYLTTRQIHYAQLWTNAAGATLLRLQGVGIPVDSKGCLMLRFRKPTGQFPTVSAAMVMKGKGAPDVFRDKIVVVGMTAVGLQDVVATPGDPLRPGVEVQATAIDNLVKNDAYRIPRGALAAELALLFIMGVASGLLISRVGVVWAPLAVACLLLATWLGCGAILRSFNIAVSPFPATVVLFGNLAVLSTWRVMTEKRREQQQLETTRRFILHVLTALTKIRDLETGAHILRVQRYAKILCDTLAADPRYKRLLTPKTIQLIYELIPLHDIGKVAIPDKVLRYPGRLSPEDFEIIKTHVKQGYEAFVGAAERSRLNDEDSVRIAKDIILAHHECWNGTGYPLGLSGDNIPLAGRIASVADVYDALVCRRVYKEGMDHEVAVNIISSNRGTLFDPAVVDAFLKVEKEIRAIKMSFEDEAEGGSVAAGIGAQSIQA